ncbi:TIR domain-containing protein [Microcoleus sp. FACHB-53]|nr:TIR domain-containing protein [Microcoleus sp. FACHB-53]
MKNLFNAFISYGRADSKAFATKLYARLLEQGLKVWFDQNDIPLGVDFQNQIDDGIEKAHNFLFIIAPHSINSPYCGKEIELAIKLNKRIIPLLHVEQINQETWQQRFPKGTIQEWEAYKAKGLHSSFPNMHPAIGKINWVYFREGIDDFEASFTGLMNLLGRHHDYVEQHTQFLAKALEWERYQKQTSYLLVGEERQQAEAWLKIHFKDEQPPCIPTDLHCEYITESIKNANNLMTQVFISYAEEDRATMEKLRNSLRRESITVWTNKTDIQTGEAFEEAIKRGIEQADNVVYLLSTDSINSDFCQQELDLALSLHKRIIPVLVQETEANQVPIALRSLQYIDLTDNVLEDDYLLDESQLLKIFHQDAAYYNEHKILLTKALKWKRQHENPSILLRGYNLRSAETWLKVAQKRTQHPPTPLQEEFIAESLRQPPAESLDVFVSYSRADADFARKLNDSLQIQGKTTWFDQESIASGSDFQQEIYRGIKVCDNFLFILSPRSVNSPYCKDEVEYAASLNKRFVTLLHREVNPSDLHPELAKVQWIDFNQNERDFNANFNQLVRTLDTDREHVHNHTKWLQRAIEWQEKDKSADLLLRGNEFAIAQNWLQEAEKQKKQPVATRLQKEYITASWKAIEASRKREKWRIIILRSLLGLVSVVAGVAVVAGVEAGNQGRQAKIAQINSLGQYSLLFSKSNRQFEGLIEAIRAGEQLQQIQKQKITDKKTESIVLRALQEAIYGTTLREHNRLVGQGHLTDVNAAVFSPDGKTIASISDDNTIKLWNLQGKLLQTLDKHTDRVRGTAFSPDGKTIASASADKTIKLWNIQGQLLRTINAHSDWARDVAFSPDGKTIVSASSDKTIKLWSTQGKLLRTLKGHDKEVRGVVFSPDGKTIASASADKTIKLWSTQGKLLRTLKGHNDEVISLVFSPDGKTIASASDDNTIKLWSTQGKLLRTLKEHTEWVWGVAFSPDGKTIASASDDNTIKLWSTQGKLLQTLKGHSDGVRGVAFSPDGKTIVSAGGDSTIRLWSSEGKVLPTLKGHKKRVWRVAFSPDGKTIASASDDTTIKLWSTQGKLLQTLKGHKDRVKGLALSPDGKTIASASDDTTIKLWSLEGQLLRTLSRHGAAVSGVAFSPDGQTIASASNDRTIKLWSTQGKLLRTFKGHAEWVKNVVFSPDGQTIASASNDKTIKLWSLEGQLLKTFKGHVDTVWAVAFSPDGQTIASASRDGTIKLWNTEGKALQTLTGHEAAVISVAFDPDGKTIASASNDSTVKLWSIEGKEWKEQQTLTGHTKGVNSVVFNPVSKMPASASDDKTVILWNLEDLTLAPLMQDACAWVEDYLKYNAPENDKQLCNGISTHK